ncbi:MAG: DUF4175 domain-containing protein [Bacteroidetes bacterium]|nr:MAG: DUF4175 domain-containing protein [Bacteroidota bacterium]REK00595.1 MAG: DUF4175 domain-containing protein [Bacteroidota bacterium]REK35283.1 MAG: DUF4175 domain-containing protein [Bacteroidota bacterium]REK48359.1 MAG: DUF4175 domain-containing protein [Bacteroidota bacterium]
MTNNNYNDLINKLDGFIRKYYKNQLIKGLIYSFALVLAFFLIVAAVEHFGHLAPLPRTILFYTFLAGMLFIMGKFIAVPLAHLYRFGKIISYEQAAQIIGKHFADVQDKLLNILQLKKQSEISASETNNEMLIHASIDQKIKEIKPVPFVNAINISENRKYLKYAAIPLLAFFIILFSAPSMIKDSTQRLIRHGTQFEKPAPFEFVVLNEKLQAIQQQDFELKIETKGNEIPAEAFIEIDGNLIRLEKENINAFHHHFRNIQGNQSFRLFADGFYSSAYTLEALPNPVLMNFQVSLEYPAYLGRKNESLQNTGDLVIPAGTKVIWNFNTQNTDFIRMVFQDTVIRLDRSGQNAFAYNRKFFRNDAYIITTSNQFLSNKDSIRFGVSVIPDLYPTISVEQQRDSFSTKRTYFKGLVKDDYGFSGLAFHYRFLKSNDTLENKRNKSFTDKIAVSKSNTSDQFFYFWDLAQVNLMAGDEIEYYFEISDNDGLAGPKSTRSQTQVFKAPTLKEIAENSEKSSQSIKDDLKKSMKTAEQIQKELNDLNKKLLDKKELSWEDKKKAEDLLKKQKELEKLLEEMRKKFEQKNKQEQEYKRVNEDILQKQEQLQALMDQVMSPEMQKLMEELEKLMENVDKSRLQEQLSELKMDNKDLQKELERAIEHFKQLEFEQKLQENIDKLNELAKKQDELAKKSDEKNADSQDLKEKQDQLNKEFEDFRKDMDDLAKKNDALEEKQNLPDTENQEQSIQQDMKNSSDQLEQKKNNKAGKSQKDATQKMEKMAQQMQQMQQNMQQEQQEEDMQALRALLENLLRLSFDQEKLMQDLRSMDINNPQYLKVGQQQRKLKDNAKMIEDSLFALSKRVIQIQAKVNQEISAINMNMAEALKNIEDRMVPQGRSRQQFIMTSVNNLTLMLSEALNQMQQQMAKSKPGTANCNKPGNSKPSLSEMRKMQEELNKNMQKMKEKMEKEGNKPGQKARGQGWSEELAKMAAQQEFIRRELQKLNQEENKDGRNALGNLEDIAKRMEESEKDIVNRMISEQTLKRQQDILTRLLESERAERERDQDEQRKSNEAKNLFQRNPAEFEEYKKLKLKEMELLKTVPPSLNSYYKQKVNEYFQSLEK